MALGLNSARPGAWSLGVWPQRAFLPGEAWPECRPLRGRGPIVDRVFGAWSATPSLGVGVVTCGVLKEGRGLVLHLGWGVVFFWPIAFGGVA